MSRESLGVGMLGYAFMGKAHSRALLALQHLDVPYRPELVSVSGRNTDAVEAAASQLGWAHAVTDWHEQVADERIALFDNGGPNAVHAEPAIAAARSGKHVLCEKPLAPTPEDIRKMIAARDKSGKLLMTAQHFRFQGSAKALKAEIDTSSGRYGTSRCRRASSARECALPMKA